ncbi:MAG: rhomboid family intramembrane serine protease [Deltaproteobacteria bacterium]|nr:rhomboid family intramembrane serine protease [Deltaproteobacteria bacterium]
MTRSKKTAILCPSCRRLISADEGICPHCGASIPSGILTQRFLEGYSKLAVNAVRIIIYVNAAFYIFSLILNPARTGLSFNPLTFLSPADSSLFVLGATGALPIAGYHRWWTLVSASYLHGGILHIFFNMAALSQLGPFVLNEYGFNRFFTIYTLSGIAGFFLSYLVGIPFTIGASACICGLIGAILYYGKSRGGHYGQAIYQQATGWVIGLVIFGLLLPGINNWAHGGGLATGILLGYLLGYIEKTRGSHVHLTLAILCLASTAAVLLWAILQAVFHAVL